MRIISLKKNASNSIVNNCADSILAGNLVIAPFDTVYGFLCSPRDKNSLHAIFKLKKRKFNKTIGLVLTNIEDICKLTNINQAQKTFIDEKIPGPYTFILPSKKSIDIAPECIKNNNLGVRVPDHQFIIDIVNKCGGCLAQTSANISGKPSCFSVTEIIEQFQDDLNAVDLIVDGERIMSKGSSEIYDLTKDKPIKIER